MTKAYNRVEWAFICFMLWELGFVEVWINPIMLCVSSVVFKIMINGTLIIPFKMTRGLHQGDPLSPYVFLLCAKKLM